ncbi:hypothetical protein AD998_00090 [bacterium 336/3]|nr:hypothetical protein AD998_00090 [bacterium 336/3]
MERLNEYKVGIAKLQNKDYYFEWQVGREFFISFEETFVENGSCKVKMTLRKSEALLHLIFDIEGVLELTCDRSLEKFDYPFHTEGVQILRFSDHSEQITDEMELIPRGIAEINVSQYIYELISLAVPMKKLHPRFQEEKNSNEELTLVYTSNKKTKDQNSEETTDPRWEELKKIFNK